MDTVLAVSLILVQNSLTVIYMYLVQGLYIDQCSLFMSGYKIINNQRGTNNGRKEGVGVVSCGAYL